jgi:hypothetical protein
MRRIKWTRPAGRPVQAAGAVLVFGLVACGGKGDTGGTTCEVGATTGMAEATVAGDAWSAAATWTEAGEGVQIVTAAADGWRFTLVAPQALSDVEGDGLPLELDIGGDDGFATAYPEVGGSSMSSADERGTMTLLSNESGRLSGCFSFEAASAAGDSLVVSGGEFVADGL